MIYHASILLYVKIEIDMLREEPASYYKERVLFFVQIYAHDQQLFSR